MHRSKSADIYESLFHGRGCFLATKSSPLATTKDFSAYDEILNNAKVWYLKGNNLLRSEFEKAFKKPPVAWEAKINNLNNIEIEKLFSVVTILCHLYRWGSLPAPEGEYRRTSIILPQGLSLLLTFLSKQLGRPPCGSLWSTTTSNYKTGISKPGTTVNHKSLNTDNIQILHSWFEGYEKEQLENWIKVFVLSEAEGVNTIQAFMSIIDGSIRNNESIIIDGLDDLYKSIRQLTKIFTQLTNPKNLNKNLWRDVIQPTFIWGLKHEGKLLQGASGLQLGVNQVIDIILGVSYRSKIGKALRDSRSYMPRHHQVFLSALEIDALIFESYLSNTKNIDVLKSYDKCIDALSRFRRVHMQVGKLFIKGDGSDKKITTTGLSMNLESNPLIEFETDMKDRIFETKQKMRRKL